MAVRCTCSLLALQVSAIALILGVAEARAAPGDRIGGAVAIVNTVTGDFAQQQRRLTPGDEIRQDELVAASADSRGEFRLDDDTKLALGPGARLTLDTFVYDRDRKAGSIVVNLAQGAFRFITGVASKPTYVVRTPNAAITVRGTIFDVYVLDDRTTWLLLHEGAIEVRGRGRTCRVLDRPGYLMRISSTGAVGVPVNWQRLENRRVPFDAAFPFLSQSLQVDPNPVLNRSAVIGARYTQVRTSACTTPVPVLAPLSPTRRADRGGQPRGGGSRLVEVEPEPTVTVLPPVVRPPRHVRPRPPKGERPPRKPPGRDKGSSSGPNTPNGSGSVGKVGPLRTGPAISHGPSGGSHRR